MCPRKSQLSCLSLHSRLLGGQGVGKRSTNSDCGSNNSIAFHSFLEDNSRDDNDDDTLSSVQDTGSDSSNMTEVECQQTRRIVRSVLGLCFN